MRIYTSYFGNVKQLEKNNVVPISIALYSPRWRKWHRLPEVAPKKHMVVGGISREEYVREYENILLNVDFNVFFEKIKTISEMSDGRDVALLCYEKPGDFCHRHLLAKFLNEKRGLEITEFGVSLSKNKETEQLSLF